MTGGTFLAFTCVLRENTIADTQLGHCGFHDKDFNFTKVNLTSKLIVEGISIQDFEVKDSIISGFQWDIWMYGIENSLDARISAAVGDSHTEEVQFVMVEASDLQPATKEEIRSNEPRVESNTAQLLEEDPSVEVVVDPADEKLEQTESILPESSNPELVTNGPEQVLAIRGSLRHSFRSRCQRIVLWNRRSHDAP